MLYCHLIRFLKGERRRPKCMLETGPSERLRPVFGTKNRILEIESYELALTKCGVGHLLQTIIKLQLKHLFSANTWTYISKRSFCVARDFMTSFKGRQIGSLFLWAICHYTTVHGEICL